MRTLLALAAALALLVLALVASQRDRGRAEPVEPVEQAEGRARPESPAEPEPETRGTPDRATQPAPSPAPTAADYREPPADGWRAWTESTGPRVVAGLVLRGVEPVPDARVLLSLESAERADAAVPPPAREARSDAAGAFRIEGVAPGDYRVRAESDGERVGTRVEVPAEGGARSVLLCFGRSVVEGAVHDDEGRPLAGVRVDVAGIGPQPERFVRARTGPDGRFRVGGLIAGRYHVHADRPQREFLADERMVDLGVAERVELVFGCTSRSVHWRSRLVDGRGEAVRGERLLRLVHAERGDERRVWTDFDGSFELRIEAGPWIAHLADGLRRGPGIGSVVLAPPAETKELLHAAGRLLVELRPADPALSRDDALGEAAQLLELHPIGRDEPPLEAEHAEGALQWLGLGPGHYVLRPRPPMRLPDEPGGARRVEIGAEGSVIALELAASFE